MCPDVCPPGPVTSPRLLLVEGTHEEHFIEALIRTMQDVTDLQVLPIAGKTQLPQYLRGLVRDRKFITQVTSLGVLRDADDSEETAFQSVKDALRQERVGLPTPARPCERVEGRFELAKRDVAVAVMILPGNGRPGALESLCVEAVRDAPVARCVDDLFRCVEDIRGCDATAEEDAARVASRDKAWANAYITIGDRPDVHVGVAASKGV